MLTLDADDTVRGIETPGHVDRVEGVEFFNGIIVPGFVNAHCHLELSHMKGLIPPGGGFRAFAAGMANSRGLCSEEERTAAMEYHDRRMWAEGVQAVGDISNGTASFPIKKSSNIHYHTFVELFGLGVHDLSPLEGVTREARRLGLPFSITPHATYSLNKDAFAAAVGGPGAHTYDKDTPLSIHFMESPAEEALFRKEGQFWEWYQGSGFEPDFLGYGSPALRLAAQVPHGRRLMLIHDTFITPEAIGILSDNFGVENITYALCPRSNNYIEGATPPVELLRRSGSNIAIGTDSLASNHSLSMVEELRALPSASLEESLRWATIGGAKALGIESWAGSFSVGKRPGAVLIEGVDWETMALTPGSRSKRIV